MTFPYLPHSAPPCIPSGIPDLPLPAWGKRQLGGGGKWGTREGPSVGFFTCLEQTAGNERSRKKLPAAQLLRPQLSGAPLPSHHATLPPSSLPPPAGRCCSQGTRVGGRVRETWVQIPFLPLTQQVTPANCPACFYLISLGKGTTTKHTLVLWAVVRTK